MSTGLDGVVALVTGASKGIGRGIARELAARGATVALGARGVPGLRALQSEIEAAGGRALALRLDVLDPESVRAAIAEIRKAFGKLDVLVNNAGGAPVFGGFADLSDRDWRDAYDFNVLGPVRVVREALPLLRESTRARIINIGSLTAIQPGSYNPHYSAAKAGLLNLGKHLSNLLARDRILVTTICAGPLQSDSWDRGIEHVAQQRGISIADARVAVDREESAKVPLGRIGTDDDIAGVVAFLAGKDAAFITGACIVVDGGKFRAAF